MFLNIFFFSVYPEDIHANIVGESMHDVPLIFEFCLLCIIQNTLALSRLLLWIQSFVLWSCTSGALGRTTGFQGKWSAGWGGEVARSKVKRLCRERGGSILASKGLQWWKVEAEQRGSHLCFVRADPALASSQNHLGSSCPAASPDPATQRVYCTIPFPSISVWERQISETIVPIQIQIMFCKGWKTEAQGWIVAT